MSISSDDYRVGQTASGIKVGDRVKVVSRAGSYEHGWGLPWMSGMEDCIGKSYTVLEAEQNYGFKLEKDGAWFPYFALERLGPREELRIEKVVDKGRHIIL